MIRVMKRNNGNLKPDKRAIIEFIKSEFPGHTDLEFPDEIPGSTKEIDAIVQLDGERIAIEHTRIVRYEHETASNVQFGSIKAELIKSCEVPSCGSFSVFLPCVDFGGRKDQRKLLKVLLDQLPSALKLVQIGEGMDLPLNGFPFKAWIHRRKSETSEIVFKQFNPEGPGQYPKTAQSISKKLDKLFPYKSKGFKTLLLLESIRGDSDSFLVIDSLLGYEEKNKIRLDRLFEILHEQNEVVNFCEYKLESYRNMYHRPKEYN